MDGVQIAVGVLLFLAGLAAPSVRVLVDELVAGRLRRRDRQEQDAGSRADEAAASCYQALGRLREALPSHVRIKHTTSGDGDLEALVNRDLAVLEDHLLLLPEDVRKRIRQAHSILQDVDTMTERDGYVGNNHPHSAWSMVRNTVDDARAVLAAFRRHEQLPGETQDVFEYGIALDELTRERKNEFYREIAESEAEIAEWRKRHKVTGKVRPPGPNG